MKAIKIILGKKRKIKKYNTSTIEVILRDKQNYKVAVRVIEGVSGLVDYLQELQKIGLKATRIMRLQISDNYYTIYKLSPIK